MRHLSLLFRSFLFAGILAFAGCGDDVDPIITDPGPGPGPNPEYALLDVKDEYREIEFQALKRDTKEPFLIYVKAENVTWDARVEAAEGETADWFEMAIDTERNFITVSPKGNNISDAPYSATIVVYDKAEEDPQESINITVSQQNDNEIVVLTRAIGQISRIISFHSLCVWQP